MLSFARHNVSREGLGSLARNHESNLVLVGGIVRARRERERRRKFTGGYPLVIVVFISISSSILGTRTEINLICFL